MDKYVLDFYCSSEKFTIELDGEHHFTDAGLVYDEKRTNYLNSLNLRVLRFENEEIFQSPEGVVAEIKNIWRANDLFRMVSNSV